MKKVRASLLILLLFPFLGLADALPPIQTVFVLVLENHNWSSIKGSANAPFLNGVLLPRSSYCAQYYNPRGLHPSLPNYLWLEAGTNFGIRNDNNPSSNHQRTTNHLVMQLKNAGISWRSYQEDISGLYVPLTETNKYAPKHNPFVYFDDVTGTNNLKDLYGIAHNRPYSELAADLTNNTVARYNFITPNLCSDTHDSCPPLNNPIRQGDNWLAAEVPKILDSQAYKNGGALLITWDEGENSSDGPIGMIVLSPLARGGGYSNSIRYTHSSLLRTLQEIFAVAPLLGDAANATNLADLFTKCPVALCSDAIVSAGANCLADVSVNNGSFDPDGDAITITQTPSGPYPPWTNNVTLTVTDSHGAVSTCTSKVVVLDTTPPAIACPSDLAVTNAHDALTTTVTFNPIVSDNCTAVGPPICVPPSGSAFELGSHAVICSVIDAAGNSGQCTFGLTVWPGNRPPVPVIEISPLARFPGETNLLAISMDNIGASVIIDGSKSYDLDDSSFSFLWLEGTTVLSTDSATTNYLRIGRHEFTLSLSDTFPLGTNSQTIQFQVISPSAAVDLVMRVLDTSGLSQKDQRPLQASLQAASASFQRGQFTAAVNQLEAFRHKLSAQISASNPLLASHLHSAAQVIIGALTVYKFP